MNKTDLVSQVAETSDLTQKDAGKAVDAVFNSILEALKNGDNYYITKSDGFNHHFFI